MPSAPSRRDVRVPTYRLHKHSGQAIVTLNHGGGKRRDVLLGKYNSPESGRKYAQVLAEWEERGRIPEPPPATSQQITILARSADPPHRRHKPAA